MSEHIPGPEGPEFTARNISSADLGGADQEVLKMPLASVYGQLRLIKDEAREVISPVIGGEATDSIDLTAATETSLVLTNAVLAAVESANAAQESQP